MKYTKKEELSKTTLSGLSEDTDTHYDEHACLKNSRFCQVNALKPANFELAKVKHLPTLFFLTLLIVFAMVVFKFAPQMYTRRLSELYQEKRSLKYLPEYFSELSSAVKACIVAAQAVLVFTLVCLTNLIKQRISVPELIGERWRNYMIIIASSLSIFSFIGLTYYNQESLYISRKWLGLTDNLLFAVYILSSYAYCMMTYILLEKLSLREVPKDCSCLSMKKYLIYLMGTQAVCYMLSMLLVSYYTPIISQEKVLLGLLMVCLCFNSGLFYLCHITFIFSLKYDLYYVNMNLQVRPDLEYFIDFEENNKMTL